MKVLTVDIETRPHLAHIWSLWGDQHVSLNQLVEVGTVISFAAKWHGSKDIEFRSDHHDDHASMVRRSHELYDEADAVVGFNHVSFDNKHLAREWILAGLGPPSPWRDIDLLSVARKRFKFASNKLEHVASELGIGHKVQHSGFQLWVDCMAGDERAWSLMRKYNRQDVALTEKLYDRLLPWISNHPHRALYDDAVKGGCPRCGSLRVIVRKHRTSATRAYRQYQCQKCHGYFAGTHSVDAVHAKAV